MSTYSLLNFALTITGPGGSISLGAGAGDAEEGITFSWNESRNTQTPGSDGTVMNSLSGNKTGKVTLRLLKTSPTNGKLTAMFNFQAISSANWAQNVMAGSDIVRGDQYSCQQVAFTKMPDNNYGSQAGTLEWVFDVGVLDSSLSIQL